MKVSRVAVAATMTAIVTSTAVSAAGPTSASPARPSAARNHISTLFSLFPVNPFLGGQTPPRQYRWVNENVLAFVQFDRSRPAEARALRYVGMSIKGTFCAEAQPRGVGGGFTHYHRLTSPTYGSGHGGRAGENQGYWLLWVAVDEFDSSDGRKIKPGVDYGFQPTPPPSCGATVPAASFRGPGEHRMTRSEIRQLARFFQDSPFRGGQTAPRLYRWVNGDVLVFLQFDKANPAKARALRYIGIAKRGRFCSDDQGHPDFAHFQRLRAKTYAKGRGGKRAEQGFWHLAVSVNPARPGVDRRFERTRAPACPKA
jgi:hypothetical protein